MNDQNHITDKHVVHTTPVTSTKKPSSRNKESIRSILSTIAVLLIAPLLAILLTKFVFQPYQVDGESMETTLQNSDRLIVWKVARTWSRLTKHDYIPKRGDIVVFTEPGLAQFGQDPEKQLIKRVVGLPGERVSVHNDVLTVYNQDHPDGFQPDATLAYGSAIKSTPLDGDWKIGQDEIFVAGDNRGNSLDSRTFGPVNASSIVGKLVVRVLPLNKTEKF